MTHFERCQTFRDLHQSQNPQSPGFVLPNAWDAASARVLERAGFAAIGTTSAGIAHARGLRDGQTLSRDEMLREVQTIIRAVSVPVNADIEAGYGDTPGDVAQTVTAFVTAGAAGINLEDACGTELYGRSHQAERLRAAQAAIGASGLPVFLNARIDTYLLGMGHTPEERLAETLARGHAYVAAGADGLFVPLATDSDLIRTLAHSLKVPLNVMAFPGSPAPAELLASGATRVSYGQSLMLAALGLTSQMAHELYESGTSNTMNRYFYGFTQASALFPDRPNTA
ncbi:isocitrate lyase/phosphoenolpyruvate mutase family protein [uncultured Deinococcus sp.]|uniref:isocitrate lyase/PEP mutase family protein n=1 Tax=uncultured Deinococcus sp. TaxID=158789 RepID=UPI00258ECBC0|nr:isocitrate lyase/phosphoenolpyruvate mutase family protein [uncultured Deinococcus sp.]